MKFVSLSEIETKCNKIHISIGLIVPFTIPLRLYCEATTNYFAAVFSFVSGTFAHGKSGGGRKRGEDNHERITRVMRSRKKERKK